VGVLAAMLAVLSCAVALGRKGAARARLARLSNQRDARPDNPRIRRPVIGRRLRRKARSDDGVRIPAALDVLAACLAAGAPGDQARASVGEALGGDVGTLLKGVARLSILGAPPEVAWEAASADSRWAPVARAVIRAHYSGAALTDVLTRVAEERRRALRADAEAAVARAGVRAVLRWGLCFLPAFVFRGVVPVVAGFAKVLWH
jgi:Flp pilus assembly protein TadB